MTHAELVAAAHRWLAGSQRHPVVLSEPVRLTCSEVPDVIGWSANASCSLVECKTSREDFVADLRKPFRRDPCRGLGAFRWFFAPRGVLRLEEIPSGWGLAELRVGDQGVGRVFRIRPPTRFADHNIQGETSMLIQAVERATGTWRYRSTLKVFGGLEPDAEGLDEIYAQVRQQF